MGRPALNLKRTAFSISPEAISRMDALVGEKGRSAFVRLAIDQLLSAVEISRRLEAEAKRRAA